MVDKTVGRPLRPPAIPTLTADNLPQVVESIVRWVQAREGRLGDGLDRAVTFRDVDLLNLTDAESLRRVASGRRALTTPISTPDGIALPPDETPPAPTDLRAFGAISNVIVTWKMAAFAAFDYFELWRAPVDALGSAVLVLTTAAPIAADQPPSGSTVYYWVRARSIYGQVGPYNAVAGVPATLALDPADLLEALDGQIKESHLYRTLQAPIRSITSNADNASEEALAALVAAHAAARRAKDSILAEAASRGTAISQTRTLVAQGDEQLASQITLLTAAVADGLSTALAAVETEELARADGDEAEAAQRTTLAVQLRGNYTGTDATSPSLSEGLIHSERQARVGADSAQVSRIETLEGHVTFPVTGLLARATALESTVIDINGDVGALVGRTDQLEAQVESPSATPGNPAYNPTFAALQTTQSALATLDGRASTAYTVRTTVSAGGRTIAGGFGLMGNSAAAPGTEIEFGILASRFWVGAPSGTGIADSQLFTIQTESWLDNGISRPAGVFIDAAYIKNLVALYATIQQLVADDIIAADISADQLTAGSIRVGSYIQATGFLAGSGASAGYGFRISGNGDAEFNNAVVRGTIYSTVGAIGGIIIQAGGLRNSGYAAGTSGFSINNNGTAEFSNVNIRGDSTFSGTLNVRSAASGARVEIQNTGLRVYHADGTTIAVQITA